MAYMQVEFYSETLRLSSSMQVIVPQRSGGESEAFEPYPVLYLLHGGSDNHTNWMRNTSIERYVSGLGVVVVMPAAHYSFYSDQKYGLAYFTFMADELPRLVRQFFRVSDKREHTFAAGLSMGGYGAFKLGIARPDRFAAVASLSGSLDQSSRLLPEPALANPVMLQMAKHTFGSLEEYVGSENDLAWLLERHLENGNVLPKFYQACGTNDHNHTINLDFYSRFAGKIDLTYVEASGRGHDWSFWDEAIREVLQWLPLRRRT